MLIHQTPTDQIKKVKLPSSIQQVLWTKPNAAVGDKVGIEVFVQFVDNNSEIKMGIKNVL